MDTRAATFEAFVTPHVGRLAVLARQYVQTATDASDLVQETLLRAWRNFSPAQPGGYQRAWLVVILRNIAAEWHRASRRRIRIVPAHDSELTELAASDLSEPFAPLPQMDEVCFREFLDDRVAASLDGLESPYREVIVLSVAGGLNYREIGEVLDCPIGTVMSRMARARRALREQLADYAAAERTRLPSSRQRGDPT
jgi:RNA polymerase sigma-70 factor (ECF subfamily)